jgi:type I restriction enzyme S subunit
VSYPIVDLGEVAEIVMGQAPSGESYNDEGDGLPLIAGASDFGRLTPQPSRHTNAPTKVSQPGDIILCVRATIGNLNLSDVPYCLGRGVAGLRPKKGWLDQRYLWRVLEANADNLRSKGRGATFLQVSKSDIAALQIPFPPLEEQRRIARMLDQADALRHLSSCALDKLNTLGRAIFHEMFGRAEAPTNDQIDLGAFLTFVTSGGRGWAKYYCERGSRFLRSFDVQMNKIGNEDIVFVNPPNNAEAKRTRIERGDVLLTITGSKIGRAAPVPDDLAGSYISQHVAILRPNQDRLLPSFLSYFLSMDEFGQKQILAKQYGQAKPGLNFEQIRSFRLPNASIERQRLFVDRLSEITPTQRKLNGSAKRTGDLFASLQHRAFKGEL